MQWNRRNLELAKIAQIDNFVLSPTGPETPREIKIVASCKWQLHLNNCSFHTNLLQHISLYILIRKIIVVVFVSWSPQVFTNSTFQIFTIFFKFRIFKIRIQIILTKKQTRFVTILIHENSKFGIGKCVISCGVH